MTVKDFIADTYRSAFPGFDQSAFHGDTVYQRLILTLIEVVPASCFIETGTYLGNSSGFVANHCPSLPIRTCELNGQFIKRAKVRLRTFQNIQFHETSSEAFISQQITQNHFGGIPLFFLDSHWYSYWPLEDEVETIAQAGIPAVIVVDDFQVPGRPSFGFDVDPAQAGKVCGIEMIKPRLLSKSNIYTLAYPAYTPDISGRVPRGHIVIFQNLSVPSDMFISGDFGSNNYSKFEL